MFSLFQLNLINARKALFVADAWRSFFFIALAAVSLLMYSNNIISARYLTLGLTILILVDLWGVDKRYLNSSDFISKSEYEKFFSQSKADILINQDKDRYYRVFTVYTNPFSEVNTSYYHKSVGGYNNLILRRYSNLIKKYLLPYRKQFVYVLKKPGAIPGDGEALLDNMPVLNMLNVKYVIYNPSDPPVFNPDYMGNAWFVKDVEIVSGADESLEKTGKCDLHNTAVIENLYADKYENYHVDSVTGQIHLNYYSPDNLMFNSSSKQDQIAVFSDIYYPYGWNAYIDGKPVEVIQADYTLRALKVPAGEHTIVFKFEPDSYKYGKIIAGISSIIVLILIAAGVYLFFKKQIKTLGKEE
ncbi:MAG: YfhO family protein [Chlorobi bacterium]|nr:YfhO family protein [Chlorobiota bacterium]